jgi:hypothetical protein
MDAVRTMYSLLQVEQIIAILPDPNAVHQLDVFADDDLLHAVHLIILWMDQNRQNMLIPMNMESAIDLMAFYVDFHNCWLQFYGFPLMTIFYLKSAIHYFNAGAIGNAVIFEDRDIRWIPMLTLNNWRGAVIVLLPEPLPEFIPLEHLFDMEAEDEGICAAA